MSTPSSLQRNPHPRLESIKIGKRWDPRAEYIGRGSPLGNPYKISETCSREEACSLYESWLAEKLESQNPLVVREIKRLSGILFERGELTLGCYCYPKQCHGESIRRQILKMLELPSSES